jgi:hypothetical protein
VRRKCHTCLCRTCLNVCDKCVNCEGKIEFCDKYNDLWQLSIFDTPHNSRYRGNPRHSLEYYGLTHDRVEELKQIIKSCKYDSIALLSANRADGVSSKHILESIKRDLSYEGLEKLYGCGEIDRIPCSRTGFYYTKKYFFSIFNEKMKEIGK